MQGSVGISEVRMDRQKWKPRLEGYETLIHRVFEIYIVGHVKTLKDNTQIFETLRICV